MSHLLENPVFHALLSGDNHLNAGTASLAYFDEAVSPFVGFDENYPEGFNELHSLFQPGRLILYATPRHIPRPKGWRLLQKVRGVQMIFNTMLPPFKLEAVPVPLGPVHVPRMVELAHLTRPGPFSDRTIEFGHYYGIFQNDKLVSMTGQRLHINNYTEVSAVCTHPDFPGRGFAGILVKHLVNIIRKNGQVPFLHVRADNEIAIRLYQKLGFSVCRPMNFYFLMRTRRLAL